MPTFRRVPEADRQRYRRLIDYAFHPEDGPQRDPDVPDRIADRYGLYDDGTLATTGALYEFDARLRGEWITLGGIAAVSTPPEHRGNGNVRRLCRSLLTECRDREIGLVALWPFSTPFYRQFGWAVANTYTVYEAPPDQLASAGTTGTGTARQVDPDDWERLRPAQLAHGEGTTLSLRRCEAWWRKRVFEHWGETPWVYAWERDGEVRGYVTYTFEDEADGRQLRTLELSAADAEARRQLLGLLGSHDSQVETVKLRLATETALLDAVENPDEVECTIDTGPMIRLCDVERALTQCPYPDDVSEALVVEVTDPLDVCAGRYELQVEDGVGTCEPTTAEPTVTVDVGTLAQLVVGYQEAATARGDGLDCDQETADRFARLFEPEQVCLREFF